MRFNPSICVAVLLTLTSHAFTATTAPSTRPAAAVYEQIGKMMTVDGPSSSAAFIAAVLPYPPQWFELAEKAYKANAAARAMLRTVPPPPAGRWMDEPSQDQRQLNACRLIANDLRDAATLAMLRGQPKQIGGHIRLLVAIGIDAMRCERLMEVSPRLKVGEVPDGVPAERVQKLINRLMEQKSADEEWEAVRADAEAQPIETVDGKARNEAALTKEVVNRNNGERTFAAMSLACQLYYADDGTWPQEAIDLVSAYLPKLPIGP